MIGTSYLSTVCMLTATRRNKRQLLLRLMMSSLLRCSLPCCLLLLFLMRVSGVCVLFRIFQRSDFNNISDGKVLYEPSRPSQNPSTSFTRRQTACSDFGTSTRLGINSGDYRIIAYCIIKLHFLSHGAKDTSDFAAAPSTSHCYCVSIPDCYSKYLHRTIFQDIYLFSYQFRTSHVHSSLVSKKNQYHGAFSGLSPDHIRSE